MIIATVNLMPTSYIESVIDGWLLVDALVFSEHSGLGAWDNHYAYTIVGAK